MTDIKWCIDYLKRYNGIDALPKMPDEALFRALQNITMPYDLSEEFYEKQDAVLQDILSRKRITDVADFDVGISLWKGDITLLKADAIVNACNNKMLGCFVPGHHCIDNAIHSFAGLQVRRDMLAIMKEQGHDEPNGECKVTKAYNLPSKFIFHTVGPIYSGKAQDEIDLKNCYLSCLKKADEMGLDSLVFCCLSTGVFGYPNDKAAELAVKTVRQHLEGTDSNVKKVVFNVFLNKDHEIYKGLLARA